MVWKLIKRILKWLAIILGAFVLLAGAYVFYNWPIAPKYKKVSDAEMQNYLTYLDTTESEPTKFISNLFRQYDVVLIGEMHRRKQDVDFVKSLIPYLYTDNGVTIIAWEFGGSDFQAEVDSLLIGRTFDERKAISILRRTNYFWNFQEYLDFYRVIWEFNRTLPRGAEKIRFLQFGSDFDESKLRSPDPQVRLEEAKRFAYDKKMADIIEREAILKNKKALWYSGLHHAFTRFHTPLPFFRTRSGDDARGGNFLYDKYPDKVYLVALHYPTLGREIFLSERSFKVYYPFSGVLDKVYDNRTVPFAIDVKSSPFANVKDNYSYYSFDHWGPISLQDYCDGYVVLCSFKEVKPVHPVKSWIVSQADSAEVFQRMLPERRSGYASLDDFLRSLEGDIQNTVQWLHTVDTTGYAQ